jgi:phage baseplate assembly protein gpV
MKVLAALLLALFSPLAYSSGVIIPTTTPAQVSVDNAIVRYKNNRGSEIKNQTIVTIDDFGNISGIKGVSYVWPGSQGAANTVLVDDGSGNLSWTAAASVISGTANTTAIFNGSGALVGSTVLNDTAGTGSVDVKNRFLLDAAGLGSLDFANRQALDNGGSFSEDWQNRNLMFNDGATTAYDWQNGLLNDSTGVLALQFDAGTRQAFNLAGAQTIDWDARQLTTGSGHLFHTALDWGAYAAYDSSSVLSLDWSNRLLQDASGLTFADWSQRFIYDTTGTNVIYDGQNDLLNDTSGNPSLLVQDRKLEDPAATIIMEYGHSGVYVINDSGAHPSVKYNDRNLMFNDGATTAYDWQNGLISDSAGAVALQMDPSNRLAIDSGNHPTIDWNAKILTSGGHADYTTLDWANLLAIDTTSANSINWGSRQSFYPDGVTVAFDWQNGLINSSDGITAINIGDRALVDDSGVAAINFTDGPEVDIYKHLQSSLPVGAAPVTATVNANAGSGATCSVSTLPASTDMAGMVTLVTNPSGSAPGDVCDVNFSKAYGAAPVCVFSSANSKAAQAASSPSPFFTSSTIAASVNFGFADTIGATYVWSYYCIGTN